MSAKIILMADNDPNFLEVRREFLEEAGYIVITACNPADAGEILEQGRVDLAILDIRLEDDDDQFDKTGLELARRFGPAIPIIVLTGYPVWEDVKVALGQDLNGLSPAVDFIAKQEGHDVMIQAVNITLEHPKFKQNVLHEFQVESSQALHEALNKKEPVVIADKFQKSLERTERDLLKHRKEISRQSERYQKIAIWMCLVGMGVLVVGAFLVFFQIIPPAVITGLAGVVSEVISARYIALAIQASRQVDKNYEDLQEIYKASHLVSICDTIKDKSKREEAKFLLVEKLADWWFQQQ